MKLVNENLAIDLIENQKLSYEQASSVLKERFPGVRGLSSWSVTVTVKPLFEETIAETGDEFSVIYNFIVPFL